MNCSEIRDRLDGYFDDELSARRRADVDLHLAACENCRAEIEELRALVGEAAQLRRDVEPERDLWPQIRAGLVGRRAPLLRGPWSQPQWVALAAAAALVAVVVVFFTVEPEDPGESGGTQTAALESPTMSDRSDLRLASEQARVEGGLMLVREDLLRSIEVRRADLDIETQQQVDRNLEIIDQAIGEIYRALEEDPNNGGLEMLLAATYLKEVEFLKQMNLL